MGNYSGKDYREYQASNKVDERNSGLSLKSVSEEREVGTEIKTPRKESSEMSELISRFKNSRNILNEQITEIHCLIITMGGEFVMDPIDGELDFDTNSHLDYLILEQRHLKYQTARINCLLDRMRQIV